MGKLWHGVFPAECLIEKYVKRSTWQPLLTTDNVRNLHEVVVHDVCEVICREFVSTLIEHLVIEDVALDANLTTDEVVYENLLAWLNLEADNILLAVGNKLINLLLRHTQGVAHLQASVSIILEVLNLGTLSLEFLRCIECDISLAVSKKLLDISLIDVAALTLTVRTMIATKADALVELDA
jgi:hypothetical protein